MKIIIKTTNIKLTPAIEDYINQKVGGLDKFLNYVEEELKEARVEIGRTTKHHQKGDIFRAEVNLSLGNKVLRSEAEEWDIKAAIDAVKDELEQEIKKYRGKQIARFKRGARLAKKLLRLSPLLWFKKKGGRDREEGI